MKRRFILMSIIFLSSGFYLRSFSQVMEPVPRDGIYDKINTPERKPIPYVSLREADVVWSTRIWRMIDLRQKMNLPFYYPENPHNGWRNFTTVIMDALKEGTITAYENNPTNEFTEPITYEQIDKRLNKVDTFDLPSPDPPYDLVRTPIQIKFNSQDVKMLRVKEDWFFDKQRSQMDVRIIGICLVKYDTVKRGYEPLFWLYYPEIRNVLAKAEVFNRFNDAERRTYEDIFWKRMFDSYVEKEKNVYDRKIDAYARGLDALLESERIQNSLFEFEHDLWEF
ncbi:MAG: gliding motility protein GldN [Bacteroidetes bacterium]|nr:gliding motility protein GldN [Bacteroidota bacterium]